MGLNPTPDHGESSYRGFARLAGRVAIVTDGDSGIGRSVAIAFAREGADVVLAYLNEHSDAEDTARYVTASLAQQFAPNGVRVNAVAPGAVWTPRVVASLSEEEVVASLSEEEIARFGADSLLGRPAQPAEIAPAYVFLASNDASYITGAVLPVTGGYLPSPGSC